MSVPDGQRVYAVGDIHGRVDLLRQMHGLIRKDAGNRPGRKCVVYLGDYVDRGMESRAVIDLLLDQPLEGFERVHLKGNHEESFLGFLEDETIGPSWFTYGGDSTVYSYGIRTAGYMDAGQRFTHIQKGLKDAVPTRHVDFLSALEISTEIGGYFFVHAGARPERSLARQTPEDMLWIRDEFTQSDFDFGKMIVHGHTVTQEPEIRKNRIGIDTGAYVSNRLTCLVLEGTDQRFIQTE